VLFRLSDDKHAAGAASVREDGLRLFVIARQPSFAVPAKACPAAGTPLPTQGCSAQGQK